MQRRSGRLGAVKVLLMAILGLAASSCGFGGVFAEDQQGATQAELLSLLNERGVEWAELPAGWEVMDIGRIDAEQMRFSVFVDRTVWMSGCVLQPAPQPEPTCMGEGIPEGFVEADSGSKVSLVFWCPPDEPFCSPESLRRAVLGR
jgi:hypothetical protein